MKSPQLESIYRSCNIVANICIYATAEKANPIAIIVPTEPALKSLASQLSISGHGLEQLVHDKKLNAAVLKQMQDTGRGGGLNGIEIIDGLVMADEEWTPQNVSLQILFLIVCGNHLWKYFFSTFYIAPKS